MLGLPSVASSDQLVKSMGCEPGLWSSIHSSKELAIVPAQAISLIMIVPDDMRVFVCVGDGVTVLVGAGVAV